MDIYQYIVIRWKLQERLFGFYKNVLSTGNIVQVSFTDIQLASTALILNYLCVCFR